MESYRYTRDGQRIPVAVATWLPVIQTQYYRLRWRREGGIWQSLSSDLPEVQFDCPAGQYESSVQAVLHDGSETPATAVNFLIEDAPVPPSDVFGFAAEAVNNGVLLRWEDCLDPDYQKTEIRIGSDFSTASLVTEKRSRTHLLDWLSSGTHVFWARHWNASLPSEQQARLEKVIRPPATSILFAQICRSMRWRWVGRMRLRISLSKAIPSVSAGWGAPRKQPGFTAKPGQTHARKW